MSARLLHEWAGADVHERCHRCGTHRRDAQFSMSREREECPVRLRVEFDSVHAELVAARESLECRAAVIRETEVRLCAALGIPVDGPEHDALTVQGMAADLRDSLGKELGFNAAAVKCIRALTRQANTLAVVAQWITADIAVRFTYENYRGEVAERHVRPCRLWYGATEWHPTPGFLFRGIDMNHKEYRDFAVSKITLPETPR